MLFYACNNVVPDQMVLLPEKGNTNKSIDRLHGNTGNITARLQPPVRPLLGHRFYGIARPQPVPLLCHRFNGNGQDSIYNCNVVLPSSGQCLQMHVVLPDTTL